MSNGSKGLSTAAEHGSAHIAVDLPDALRPRKRPRQARARATVQAILQAAAEVFAELGYAATTTNKIADRAGVSVGSLYQYFPGKDALLAGLVEDHMADVRKVVGRGLEVLADPATPLDAGMRRLITNLVALHTEQPAMTHALGEAMANVPEVSHALRVREAHFPQMVASLLRSRPDVRSGDPLLMAMLLGQVTEALTRWLAHEAPPEVDQAAAIEELVRMLVGYLQDGG
jgi:AcrR family transcriptional regulator